MSIKPEDVEGALESCGLQRARTTKKVVEYKSPRNSQVLYFRTEIGLPSYVHLVIHPDLPHHSLTSLDGVVVNDKELQHGSNMTAFPKRKNEGEGDIHFGRALNIESLEALDRFAQAFQVL